MRRLVSWVLWKVATTDPESDIPWRGYSVGESACIQSHGEELFKDTMWIASVIGEFAANHITEEDSVEWAAFAKAMEEKP
jgi:hypothetical protein